METTQRTWILFVTLLSMNSLMTGKGAKAAKIHLIINVAGLIHIYVLKMP